MGNCLTSNVPKGVQLNEAHLLGKDVIRNKQQRNIQQHNLTDSEQQEFQYREIEPSLTHNSNLNNVVPSNNSSPKHRPSPIKTNGMIYGKLDTPNDDNNNINMNINNNNNNNNNNPNNLSYGKLNSDLQRQIDILKQCSNDEIKMLKARIQFLENKFDEINIPQNDNEITDDYKNDIYSIDIQCSKGTPTKSCPNILRIVKISKLYNTIIEAAKEHNEFEIWSMINRNNDISSKQYDLVSLIEDYCHMLQVHCNNNNIFDIRMVYLEINDIVNSKCTQQNCKCIININESFKPNLIYILDVIHCYLYHGYNNNNNNDTNNDNDSMQRLRDCIMDRNDIIIEYNKNGQKPQNHPHHDMYLNKMNLSIKTSVINSNNNKNENIKIYAETPPVLLNQRQQKIIANIGQIPFDPHLTAPPQIKSRHGSVNSVISNISHQSSVSAKSSQSISRLSSLSVNNQNNIRSDTDPDIIIPKIIIAPISNQLKRKPSAIEMSEERVRKLSGQINEDQLKELIDEYGNNRSIAIEIDDDDDDNENENGLIIPSDHIKDDEDDYDDDDDDEPSSSLDENERAEIENFKLKLDNNARESESGDINTNIDENDDDSKEIKPRRGSKHNLMRLQQGNEWNADEMNQTVEEMKKQLLHLALTSQIDPEH